MRTLSAIQLFRIAFFVGAEKKTNETRSRLSDKFNLALLKMANELRSNYLCKWARNSVAAAD